MAIYKEGYNIFTTTNKPNSEEFFSELKTFILDNTPWEFSESSTSTSLTFTSDYFTVTIAYYSGTSVSITSKLIPSNSTSTIYVDTNDSRSEFTAYQLCLYVLCKNAVILWSFGKVELRSEYGLLEYPDSILYNCIYNNYSNFINFGYFEINDGLNDYPAVYMNRSRIFMNTNSIQPSYYLKDSKWKPCYIYLSDIIDSHSSNRNDVVSNKSYVNDIPVSSSSEGFIGVLKNIKKVSRNNIKDNIARLQYPFGSSDMKYQYIIYPYVYVYDKGGE